MLRLPGRPQSRVRLLDLVREQARAGTTVVYTTHYMEEAQDLCDRIAIVDHGKLLAIGTLEELRRLVGEQDLVRLTGRFDAHFTALWEGGHIKFFSIKTLTELFARHGLRDIQIVRVGRIPPLAKSMVLVARKP